MSHHDFSHHDFSHHDFSHHDFSHHDFSHHDLEPEYIIPIPDPIHCDVKEDYVNIVAIGEHQAANAPRPKVLRPWKWELLSLVFSLGMLVAVFAILGHFDGQQLPQWPLSANLSTLVSILSILFRTAILFVVAEVFGQLRWTMFRNPRPLADLDHVERAGHSAWSAAMLLVRAPKSLFVVLGTIITIGSLAVGPFMQQSIRTFSCVQPVPGANATVPAGNYVDTAALRMGAGIFDLPVDMKAAMINGLANPAGRDSALQVDCPSGNCVFPEDEGITYSTIGMCGSCIDTSSAIPLVNGSVYQGQYTFGNISLPTGVSIATNQPMALANIDMASMALASGVSDNFSWAAAALTSEFATLASRSLHNFTILTYTNASCDESPGFTACSDSQRTDVDGYDLIEMRPLAASCTIYACLKSFSGAVVDGQLRETEVSTRLASPVVEAAYSSTPYDAEVNVGNFTAVQEPCLVDGRHYDASNFSLVDAAAHEFDVVVVGGANVSVPLECLYKLRGTYGAGLGRYMRDGVFNGACAGSMGQPDALTCPGAFWLANFWAGGAASLASVDAVLAGFTTAATNALRAAAHSLYYADAAGSRYRPGGAQGVVYASTVCTRFEWQWLVLPAVVMVLTIVLIGSMVAASYRCRDQPVWKSSSLPLVLYGFTDGFRSFEKLDRKQMDDFAERTHVRLRTDQVLGFEYVEQSAHATTETPGQSRGTTGG